jgi:hypothetical protein
VVPARSIGWAVALASDESDIGLSLNDRDLDAISAANADRQGDSVDAAGGDVGSASLPVAVIGLRPGALSRAHCAIEDGTVDLELELGRTAPVLNMAVAFVDRNWTTTPWQRIRVASYVPESSRRWTGRLELPEDVVAIAVATGGGLHQSVDPEDAASWWYRTGWLQDSLGLDPQEAWMRAAAWWTSAGDAPRASAVRSTRADGRFRRPVHGLAAELARYSDFLMAGALRTGDRSDAEAATQVFTLISDFGGQMAALDLELELE